MTKAPDLRYERRLWLTGFEAVAGVDEAGVGPMAGPVVAAAVIFAPETFIKGVHDSKQLSAEKREELFPLIQERAHCVGIGVAEVDEIDRHNIYHATMRRSYAPSRRWPARPSMCWSTAAASRASRFRRRGSWAVTARAFVSRPPRSSPR